MHLHLVKDDYGLQDCVVKSYILPVASADYENEICEQTEKMVCTALDGGVSKLALLLSSLPRRESNYSYTVNTVIECVAELKDKRTFPDDFRLYLVGAIKSESECIDSYISGMYENEEINNYFGSYGDKLMPRFEEYQGRLKKDKEFRYLLLELIEKKGFKKDSDAYKAAGVSKSVFSRKTNKALPIPSLPSRGTVAAFAIGLRLNIEETSELYKSAGYFFGNTDIIDRTIRFFIENKIYDIDEVNYCLYYYGYPPLGERSREDRMDFRMSK